jgi:hypothetical protein
MTIRIDQMPPAVRAEYDRLIKIPPPQPPEDFRKWLHLIQFWDDREGSVYFEWNDTGEPPWQSPPTLN